MRKTILFALIISALPLFAEEYTYTMSDYGKPAFTTTDGKFTTLGKKNDGVTGPTYNGSATSLDVRLYAKNTYTITSNSDEKMTSITFCISKNGHAQLAELTPSTGSMSEPERLTDDAGYKAWRYTWTGNTKEVTFVIGDSCTYGYECSENGKSAAGTLFFKSLVIKTDAPSALHNSYDTSSLELFVVAGTVHLRGIEQGTLVEIYNLTGARIYAEYYDAEELGTQLNKGMYIVRVNNETHKLIVR